MFSLGVRFVSVLVVLQLAVLQLVFVTNAWAQSREAGTLIVRATDPEGFALPDVRVHTRGPVGTRTRYTGLDGSARVHGLYPGDYTVTLSHEGFQTVVREGLKISVGRTVTVSATLNLASVQETVNVVGQTPVIDLKSTNVGSLYGYQMIEDAPTASGLWAGVLAHLPGIVLTDLDVGGDKSGNQPGFNALGSIAPQNVFHINGANTTDPVALGGSSTFYSIASFEEVGVSTASHDLEIQGAGVAINIVTKSGSNRWHGGARFFYENEDLVSNNVDDDLEARGVGEGNPPTLLRDMSLQLGGPIVPDRAWFFVDFWDFIVERRIIGLPADEIDDTSLTNWTVNGTWQINDVHKISARYFTDRKFRSNVGASPFVAPQSALIQDSFVDIPQLQWQGVLGPDMYATASLSKLDIDFPLRAKSPDSPAPHPDFETTQPPTFDLFALQFYGWPQQESFDQRDRTQLNGMLYYFRAGRAGSHDLKIGGEYDRSQRFRPLNVPFGVLQIVAFGAAQRVLLYNADPTDMFEVREPDAETNRGRGFALFAQDAWTIGTRFTLNAGIRWDRSKTYYPDQKRPESFWPELGSDFQEMPIAGVEPLTDWSDVAPRVGAIYDLTGDGRTALKASYARYSEAQGTTWASRMNPNRLGLEEWLWSDFNGDGVFQSGENLVLLRRSFGSSVDIDPDIRSPITDEFTVGVDRELFDGFSVGATFVYRDRDNVIDDVNVGEPYGPIAETLGVADPWTPVTLVDPGPDGIVGTADDGGPFTAFSNAPPLEDFFLITNLEKFGFDPEWNFKGVELVAHKRWGNNWQLLASYNYGRSVVVEELGNDPNLDINSNGVRDTLDRPHMLKITANYLFDEPVGVNVGAFLRVLSGEGRGRVALYNAADGLAQGFTFIQVASRRADKVGPSAHEAITLLDLRAEKRFSLGRYGLLHAYLDVFNLFNANQVTRALEISGPLFDQVLSIVPPRVVRLGLAWDF